MSTPQMNLKDKLPNHEPPTIVLEYIEAIYMNHEYHQSSKILDDFAQFGFCIPIAIAGWS